MLGKIMIEILILWVCYALYMAILVHKRGSIGGIFFYPKVMQDRVIELHLITPEELKRRRTFAYMTQFSTGDLSHMPYTHIYYGRDEVLSAAAERLVEAFHRDGSECELHIGEGLFHCYPAIDLFPETRAVFDEIVRYLS